MTNQIMTKSNAEARSLMEAAKLAFELMPAISLEAWLRVIMFGAYKYAPNNWRGMMLEGQQHQFLAAIQRHALKMQKGEVLDPDTGLPHAAHIMCNASFLTWDTLATPEEKAKWEHMKTNAKESLKTPAAAHSPTCPSKKITLAEAKATMPAERPKQGDRVRLLMSYSRFNEGEEGIVASYNDDEDLIRLHMADETELECFVWRVRKV